MSEHHDDPLDLPELDRHARAAAEGLDQHVQRSLDVEASLAALPLSQHRRGWGRAAAVAAAIALVVGTFAVIDRADDGGRTRVEVDDDALPDVELGVLRPLGPRDGRDSIQLPTTAEPSTGLRDGDVVTVRAEGFVPGEGVGIVQCAREAGGDAPERRGGVDGCNLSGYTSIDADEDGVATGTYQVRRVLTTPLTGTVDCAAEAERCLLGIGAVNDYDRSGGVRITFATDVAPIQLPTAAVAPAEGLEDGDVVHVSGEGLTPDDVVYLEVCSSDPLVCWQTGEVVDAPMSPEEAEDRALAGEGMGRSVTIGLLVDGDGRIDGDVPVWRFLPGDEPGTYVDCAISRCSLRINGSTAPPTVPLAFAGGGNGPVPAALGADRTDGLAPGDTVVVRGVGFAPRAYVGLMVCARATQQPGLGFLTCGSSWPDEVQADDQGEVLTELLIPALSGMGESEECNERGECTVMTTTDGGGEVRCDGVDTSCFIVAESYTGEPTPEGASVPPPTFHPVPVEITFR
jgi:hypothetical protein